MDSYGHEGPRAGVHLAHLDPGSFSVQSEGTIEDIPLSILNSGNTLTSERWSGHENAFQTRPDTSLLLAEKPSRIGYFKRFRGSSQVKWYQRKDLPQIIRVLLNIIKMPLVLLYDVRFIDTAIDATFVSASMFHTKKHPGQILR
jgi:hypothetical protein